MSYPLGDNASGWVTQLVTQLELRVNGMLDEESAAKKRAVERSDKFLKGAQDISQSADPIKDTKEL